MNQSTHLSRVSCCFRAKARRIASRVASGLLGVVLLGPAFSQPAQAEPLVRVLFGNDSCTFLPDRPTPTWVNKRPNTADFVGISSAPRMANPTEQIQAAELNARTALAAEIEVAVSETMKVVMDERNRTSGTTTSVDSNDSIVVEGKQAVNQTLMGARIEERWLDRENCIVHVLATATKASVEEAQQKLAERLRKLFKFKLLMLLDRSEVQGDMTKMTRELLTEWFIKAGNRVVAADSGHAGCGDNPLQPACQTPPDVMYAGYKIVLDKEAATAEFKRRIYKLTGSVRYKDRVIASFDAACQGTGKLSQDFLIDQQAAKACFEKARPSIENGMKGSE